VLPFYARNNILFCPGNLSPVLSHIFWRKTVFTLHSLAYKYFSSSYSLAFKVFYNIVIPITVRLAKKIITVSNSEKEAISKIYPFASEKIEAIQNGGISGDISPQEIKSSSEDHSDYKPYILFVGSLTKSNNPQLLIRALEELDSNEIKIVFAGTDNSAFSKMNLHIPDKVKNRLFFLGNVNETIKIISLYQNAEFLVVPTLYEASSLPPIEAMACGCSVIASDIPSLVERCQDAAIYFKPNDVGDLALKMNFLVNDEENKKILVGIGKELSKKYTWRNCALQTIATIKSTTYTN
jgi:glycosyltransferase involved in cell wall biosynthesis